MAYDHFWYRPLELDASRFSAMVADIRFLAEHAPEAHGDLTLFGPSGSGEPIFTDELVSFCGDDQYARFVFPRVLEAREWEIARAQERADGLYFQDCRTGGIGHRVRQGSFACVCLLVIQHHLPEIQQVASDGGYGDWYEAVQRYQATLDRSLSKEPWSRVE